MICTDLACLYFTHGLSCHWHVCTPSPGLRPLSAPKFRTDERQSSLVSTQSCSLSLCAAHYRDHLSPGSQSRWRRSGLNVVSCETLSTPCFESGTKLKAVSFVETWSLRRSILFWKNGASATETLKRRRGSQFVMDSIWHSLNIRHKWA